MPKPRLNVYDQLHYELRVIPELETEKAWCIDVNPKVWLPKSQAVIGEQVADNVYEFEIAAWWARKHQVRSLSDN